MDQDIFLNALSAADVKAAYESNADTNAFTDSLKTKLETTDVFDESQFNSHINDATIHFTQAQISITESQISDLQSYELADATILKSADIGVTVQGFDADTVIDPNYETFDSSATYENLRAQATTAGDVGLGNVANESKATMFTDPEFTGVPIAPTAALNTDTTQIATTAFVQQEIAVIDGGEFN
jgi:hypothetical protein